MSKSRAISLLYVAFLYGVTALFVASLFQHHQPLAIPRVIQGILLATAVIILGRYIVYTLLGSYFSIPKRSKVNTNYNPLVSVVIPAWNEEVGIIQTLSSIVSSTYRNLEVIVVNDGSTDNSDEKIRSFITQYKASSPQDVIPVTYHVQGNAGKGSALNTGVSLANGDIVITVDADSYMQPNTITEFVNVFANPNIMAAVGTVKIGNSDTVWGLLQRIEYITGFYFKRADAVMNSIYIIGGAAGAFRKSIFHHLGPFRHDHITEDIELTLRIQKAGYKIAYASKAVVVTEGASTLRGLLRQRLRWKRGRIDAFISHRDLFFSRSKTHRKLLSWFVLPFAVLGDAYLLLELPFLATLLVYGAASQNFIPLLAGIVLLMGVTSLQIIISEKGARRLRLLLLAPISWWLLLGITAVELTVLMQALWYMKTGKSVHWQKWNRVGLVPDALPSQVQK